MSEEKKNTPFNKSNDLRTFAIAFLTAIIVVALYHFGGNLCRMFCPPCAGYYSAPVRYMLIPVTDNAYCGSPCFRKKPGACFPEKKCAANNEINSSQPPCGQPSADSSK